MEYAPRFLDLGERPQRRQVMDMSQGLFTILPDRGVVRVAGAEAREFLQRLITADLDKAAPGQLSFGALAMASSSFTPPKRQTR